MAANARGSSSWPVCRSGVLITALPVCPPGGEPGPFALFGLSHRVFQSLQGPPCQGGCGNSPPRPSCAVLYAEKAIPCLAPLCVLQGWLVLCAFFSALFPARRPGLPAAFLLVLIVERFPRSPLLQASRRFVCMSHKSNLPVSHLSCLRLALSSPSPLLLTSSYFSININHHLCNRTCHLKKGISAAASCTCLEALD